MPGFEGFSLSGGLVGFYALLSKADGFDLSTGFGYDNVGFGGVTWGSFRFVVTGDSCPREPGVALGFACSHLFGRSLWSLFCPPVRHLGWCSVDLVLLSPPIVPPFRYVISGCALR